MEQVKDDLKYVTIIHITNGFGMTPGPGIVTCFVKFPAHPPLCDDAVDISAHSWTHQNFLMPYKNEGAEGHDTKLPFCTARRGICAAVLSSHQVCTKNQCGDML